MDLIGKQLPSVSEADNGKVLGVENGNWRAITPAAPADMVYIPYSDLNYSSIQAALAAGKTPFTKHTVLSNEYTFYLMENVQSPTLSPEFILVCVTPDSNFPNVFQMHFLYVTPSTKVTATEQFYDKIVVDELSGAQMNITEAMTPKDLPFTVFGKTATMDLTSEGGVQAMLQKYAAGKNYQFIALNVQSSPDNILIFNPCGIATSATNLHVDLSCISDTLVYYVRLVPVDTNIMRGTFVETPLGT